MIYEAFFSDFNSTFYDEFVLVVILLDVLVHMMLSHFNVIT